MANVGRPTLYSEELVAKAQEYLDMLPKDEVVHSIEGLSLYLDIDRSTVYAWSADETKPDFSYIVSKILAKQGKTLVNSGLNGTFNSKIAGVMLSKHGYREGHDMTTDGKALAPILVKFINDENDRDTK